VVRRNYQEKCKPPSFLEYEMATYVILSRFSPEAFEEPKELRKLADAVSSKIRQECKSVSWKQSFATLGRFDVVDIVEADDPKDIERAAMIIRGYGHSTTEQIFCIYYICIYIYCG
jgi:uncharacterized protein with GYD domain